MATGARRFLVTRDRPAWRDTFSSILALFPGGGFREVGLAAFRLLALCHANRAAVSPKWTGTAFEAARFYDKSGGLRAGNLAARRKVRACPCKSAGGFIAAACDLAKAAPKSVPVPGAAKGRA
jgi:hypothetical protein